MFSNVCALTEPSRDQASFAVFENVSAGVLAAPFRLARVAARTPPSVHERLQLSAERRSERSLMTFQSRYRICPSPPTESEESSGNASMASNKSLKGNGVKVPHAARKALFTSLLFRLPLPNSPALYP